MPSSRFSRLYRKVLNERLMPAGFKESHGYHWRERDRLAHVIGLDRSRASDFTGLFAAMPLVYPEEHFSFGFGGRLHEVGPEPHGNWPTPDPQDPDQIARVVGGYVQSIERYAFPWLDRFNRPIDLVRADEANSWRLFRPYLGFAQPSVKHLRLGICALSEGDLDSGRTYLELALKGHTAYSYPPDPGWDHVRADIALCEFYLDCLRRGDAEAIRSRITSTEAFTRQALSLSSESVNRQQR